MAFLNSRPPWLGLLVFRIAIATDADLVLQGSHGLPRVRLRPACMHVPNSMHWG